jgi:preprotein translocase subunit YajC
VRGNSQLIFLLIMVALLVFMFSRTRKQQRAQQQMQGGVAPGAEVMTTSGMFGTVVSVDGDEVVLEIAPGLRTRWTRRAVARVVTASGTPEVATGSPEVAGGGLSFDKGTEGASRLDASSPQIDGDATGGATRSQ